MSKEHIQEIEALILSGDIDLDDYRSRFKNNQNRDMLLDDDQLIEYIAVDEEEGPLDIDDFVGKILEREANLPQVLEDKVSIVGSTQSLAMNMAGELDADEAFNSLTKDILEAYELVKRAPIVLLWEMKDKFGWDYIDQLPIPGSYVKAGRLMIGDDEDIGPVGNRRADKFKVKVRQTDGTEKEQPRTFYKTLSESYNIGKNAQSVIDNLALAADPKTRYEAKEPYKSMSTRKRLAELDRWKFRKARLPLLFKQAVQCRIQYLAIESLNGVKTGYMSTTHTVDGKETVSLDNVNKPFWISDNKGADGVIDVYTVAEYLRFDVKTAKENGGTYDALIATIARAPKKTTSAYPELKTVEESSGPFAVLSAFFSQDKSDWKKRETALITFLTNKDNTHELLSFGDTMMSMDGVFNVVHTAYDAARLELKNKESKERQDKAREQAKKLSDKHNESVKTKPQKDIQMPTETNEAKRHAVDLKTMMK
jgi:hypothetical protein